VHGRAIALEAARREHRHVVRRLRAAELDAARSRDEDVRERVRVEAPADGQRIPRLPLEHGHALRLEPAQRLVEAVVDEPLQLRIALRALLAEELEAPVAPDEAGREEHRPAWPVALLEQAHRLSELAG